MLIRTYKSRYELAVKVAGSMAEEIMRLKIEAGKLKEEIKVRESEIAGLKIALNQSAGDLEAIKSILDNK